MPAPPAHLEPSELGTKEYWDHYYSHSTDLIGPSSLSSSPRVSQELDGWFSDVDAASKILAFLTGSTDNHDDDDDDDDDVAETAAAAAAAPKLDVNLGLDQEKTRFLDLGTGNGEMLFLLREQGGFRGRMLGVDYSVPSVDLARKLAAAKGLGNDDGGEGGRGIEFEVWDIMHEAPQKEWKEGFDVVLDKGTFDAISLCDEQDAEGRRLSESYRARVERLVTRGGFFLVTSCNWTEKELMAWFEDPGSSLQAVGKVPYPSFSFGGQSGQSISTLCFRKQK